jgi:glycosyltransferase involved in cell wall biosynthesis
MKARRKEPTRSNKVTVGIPVGPAAHHAAYLRECIASVLAIPEKPDILIIDDMHGVEPEELGLEGAWRQHSRDLDCFWASGTTRDVVSQDVYRYETPWRMGVAQAFNLCVALAKTQFVLTLGADDTVETNVISAFTSACPMPLRDRALLTFWGLPVRYMDTGEVQTLPCNAAIVSRDLWRHTGGFSPEMGVGACDSMLLSIMIGNDPEAGDIRMVGEEPLYNYRRHDLTDTATRADFQGAIFAVRDALTSSWSPQTWRRRL